MNTPTKNWQSNFALTTGILLCIAAFAFPFSVAATNVALAFALATGAVSGQLWQGTVRLWQQQQSLLLAIFGYLTLVLAGLAWSLDRNYGMEIAGHLWLWLILPLLIAILQESKWRNYFLIALSSGLALHLLYCVLQRLGIVPAPESAGSSLIDATGFIGHISFGIVYGIWGGWLLHFGWQNHGRMRLVPWLLSFWAFVMVFLAEGRSGYLVAAVILSILFWKHLISGRNPKRMLSAIAVFALLTTIVAIGPGKERISNTVDGIHAAWNGDLEKVEERWLIWMSSVKLWNEYPLIGVGTGGFGAGIQKMRQRHPEQPIFKYNYSHSHNIYLQSLVRWGPLGLLVICSLFWFWLRAGSRRSWNIHTNALVILSSVALVIHGLSSVSLEEHFATIFALFALAIGLSNDQEET